MGFPAQCRVCRAWGQAERPGPWECDACLAGEEPEGTPHPGLCDMGGHLVPHLWGPTRWGWLCSEHLRQTCRVAVWPAGWP
jgi:hypothetical protein